MPGTRDKDQYIFSIIALSPIITCFVNKSCPTVFEYCEKVQHENNIKPCPVYDKKAIQAMIE